MGKAIDTFIHPGKWNAGLLIGAVPEAIRSTYNAFSYNNSASDFSNMAGIGWRIIGNRAYQYAKNVDEGQVRDQTSSENFSNTIGMMGAGAAAGSVAGPIGAGIGAVGGLIGGLFAGDSRTSKMEEQLAEHRSQVEMKNAVGRSIALSQNMKDEWNLSFLDTYNQVRLGKDGIDSNMYNNIGLAQKNEHVYDAEGNAEKIKIGTPGVDEVPVDLSGGKGIITNKNGLSIEADLYTAAQEFANDALRKINLLVNNNAKNASNLKIAQNVVNGSKEVKNLLALKEWGKAGIRSVAAKQSFERYLDLLPQGDNNMRYADNGIDSLAVNLASGGIGLGLFIGAAGDSIATSNTYKPNLLYYPGMLKINSALTIPLKLLLNQSADAMSKGFLTVRNSGGLGTSLKLGAYSVITSNSLTNNQNMLFNYYKALSDLKMKAGELELGEGRNAAQMMQNAAQWDLDYYSKAHAARQNVMNMGIINTIGSLRQILKDKDSNRWFELMKDQYIQDREAEREKNKNQTIPTSSSIYYPSIVYPTYENGYGAPWWPNK